MQTDGNLVGYKTNQFIAQNAFWSSKTNGRGHAPYRAVMQPDGNFVVYDKDNKALWSTISAGKGVPGHQLVIQDDSNVVLYDGNKGVHWNSKHM